jgi:hypothetical protein
MTALWIGGAALAGAALAALFAAYAEVGPVLLAGAFGLC